MGAHIFGLFWPYSNLWRLAWTIWAWAQCRFGISPCCPLWFWPKFLPKGFQSVGTLNSKICVWTLNSNSWFDLLVLVCVCVLVSFMRAQWGWDMSLFMASLKKFLPKISECVELGNDSKQLVLICWVLICWSVGCVCLVAKKKCGGKKPWVVVVVVVMAMLYHQAITTSFSSPLSW